MSEESTASGEAPASSDASAPSDASASDDSTLPENAPDSEEVPDWDDEYVDRVSDRLMFNYDLEKDRRVRGERFTLYGKLEIHTEKHFFHPALSYGHHVTGEHLFVRRESDVTVADVERFVELGHGLADEWIDADEEHYGTEFTFVFVVPEVADEVRKFVSGFRDRTMLKYGYHGQYEINLVVVAPDEETVVSSQSADVEAAFTVWRELGKDEKQGVLGRLVGLVRS